MKSKKTNDFLEWIQSEDELKNIFITQFGRLMAGFILEEKNLPEICPYCKETKGIAKRRRNTSYLDDKLNWLISCQACFGKDYEQFQEMWDDYYSGCL